MVAAQERTSTGDAILDATDRLMARYGFRKMTMDDVAREAGIGKRTIYLHFKSKEDVGLSSIDRVVHRVHVEMEKLSQPPAPVEDRLRAVLQQRVMGRLQHVQEYRESLDELFEAVRPSYLARRSTWFDREVGLIASLLREGVESNSFQTADPMATARAMVQATNAFLPYSLSVRELGALDQIEPMLGEMVGVLLRGVISRQPQENNQP